MQERELYSNIAHGSKALIYSLKCYPPFFIYTLVVFFRKSSLFVAPSVSLFRTTFNPLPSQIVDQPLQDFVLYWGAPLLLISNYLDIRCGGRQDDDEEESAKFELQANSMFLLPTHHQVQKCSSCYFAV